LSRDYAASVLHLIYFMSRFFVKAFITLKKGTQLVKYSRKGKPKLCSFRLSAVSIYAEENSVLSKQWYMRIIYIEFHISS